MARLIPLRDVIDDGLSVFLTQIHLSIGLNKRMCVVHFVIQLLVSHLINDLQPSW